MSWRARLASGVLAAALATPVAAAEKQATGEGIKVHGHWTIEVRNADGTLGSRRDVENALVVSQTGGASLLAGFLANHYSDPIWTVSLYGPNTTGPCRHDDTPQFPCRITEERAPSSGTEYSKNLVLGLPMGSGPQPRPLGTLELSGSATAADDASIVLVDSSWYVAARNQFGSFTAKSLSPAIEVRAGQIIHVRVVFSFS